ncbi:MAG: hypothetical protein WEA10_02095 [Actinomycetota bacterium]
MQPQTQKVSPGPIVMIVGAVVMAIGSVLPWATISIQAAERSIGGLDGDGVITVICAVLVALAALVWLTGRGWGRVLGFILAIVAGGVAVYDLVNITDTASDLSVVLEGFAEVSAGIGIWLVVAGAVIAIIGGFLPGTKGAPVGPSRPQPSSAAPAPAATPPAATPPAPPASSAPPPPPPPP